MSCPGSGAQWAVDFPRVNIGVWGTKSPHPCTQTCTPYLIPTPIPHTLYLTPTPVSLGVEQTDWEQTSVVSWVRGRTPQRALGAFLD